MKHTAANTLFLSDIKAQANAKIYRQTLHAYNEGGLSAAVDYLDRQFSNRILAESKTETFRRRYDHEVFQASEIHKSLASTGALSCRVDEMSVQQRLDWALYHDLISRMDDAAIARLKEAQQS